MTTRAGALLGRHQINSKIGSGSMGAVYRARDPKIDRTVAIKTVSLAGLEPDAEREYRQRFVVEAQAAGRLSHPGIVTIFDVAEDPETGAPYLVMEYIEGESLEQVLRRKNERLPLSTALQLTQELAQALHYAHAQGVVHRDIKPANILVTTDGHAKITDFGVAKLNQSQLTQHGQILGSPAYMAPEQLRDEGVDARSDLFSLGVVLYFMLTGNRPFQGSSIATVCFKLATHEPLAVATYDLSFPKELDTIVSRAMAKNRAQRYQSGEEMADDIQRLREDCGFVQPADVTRRAKVYPASPPGLNTSSLRAGESASGRTSNSGVQEATRALRTLKVTRTSILALVLVIAATGFVVFSQSHNLRTPASTNNPPNQPAVESTSQPPAPPLPATTELDLEIEHPFTEARASIWLDSQLVYTQVLHADLKNHMLIFRRARGHESHKVELRSGRHQVRVRVQSPNAAYDQSRTLAVNFVPKSERTLRVNCDKKHNLLQLTLQ
jgi:serine/threonine protein kinase